MISNQLSDFMDLKDKKSTRQNVLAYISNYVKEKKLNEGNDDKRVITMDDKLKKLFPTVKTGLMTFTDILKLVKDNNHILDKISNDN